MAMGTFGSLTQARLAIYAAQTGISVTGNNISNINTPGYTRQRLNQVSLYVAGADRYYAEGDVRTGQGALVKSLSQIRSPYLDIRFREENAKVGYNNAKLEGLDAIARILDEVGKGDASLGEDGFGVLGLEINNLVDALQNLADQTGHQEYDNIVRQVASNLVNRLNSYANRLEQVRDDTVMDLREDVKEVNGLLTSIRTLNEEIRRSEIHGDPALELRDQRNLLIDELSGLIDINVTYSEEVIAPGLTVEKLTIRLGDANPDGSVETDESLLVDGVFCAQLSMDEEDNYSMTVSELRNKIGDLYKIITKYEKTPVGGTDQVVTGIDPQGNPIEESIKDLFADGEFSVTKEVKNYPSKGDVTTTTYTRKQVGTDDATGEPVYEYTAQRVEQIASRPVKLEDNDLGGEIQAERELLTEKGEFIDQNTIDTIDKDAAGKRGIEYYQRSLDLLANKLAEFFNDANQGFLMDPDGNYIYEGTNAEGKTVPVPVTITVTRAGGTTEDVPLGKDTDLSDPDLQQALLEATGFANEAEMTANELTYQDLLNAYLKGQEYDAASGKFVDIAEDQLDHPTGIFKGGVLFSNGSNGNDTTDITAANISISLEWSKNHILQRSFTCPVGSTEPASGQSDNITHMKYLLSEYKWDFCPDSLTGYEEAGPGPMFTGTIFEMWNNIGSTLGKDQKYTNTELTVAYESALSIDTDRDSVSSVDFNDEAMNLMMYSKSYNAACRLMTTIDSVLDKLINGTGLTT